MRGLGGGPHGHPVAVHSGRDRARLHGARDEPLDPEIERELDLARRRLGRAFGVELPDEGPVPLCLVVERLRPIGPGRPGIAGAGEVPVVHVHERGGVDRLLGGFRNHGHHRIPYGEHLLVGERPAGGNVQLGEGAAVRGLGHREGPLQRRQDVRRGEDAGDSGGGGGFLRLDRDDLRVRIRAPHHREMERAGQRDVRRVERLTGDQAGVFPPPDPLADGLGSDRQVWVRRPKGGDSSAGVCRPPL